MLFCFFEVCKGREVEDFFCVGVSQERVAMSVGRNLNTGRYSGITYIYKHATVVEHIESLSYCVAILKPIANSIIYLVLVFENLYETDYKRFSVCVVTLSCWSYMLRVACWSELGGGYFKVAGSRVS